MLKINEKKSGLKNKVLSWLDSLRINETEYRMGKGTDHSLFTTCFALFLYDLFNEVKKWPVSRKKRWARYINSFQDRQKGYFIPKGFRGPQDSKTVLQLTCFCLSALGILRSSPRYKLKFIQQWLSEKDLYSYLKTNGCFEGRSTSGNMAMFAGICLTWLYEKEKNKNALERMDFWLNIHDKEQNSKTGFWGMDLRSRYYSGFQNSFHQYVVYNYWQKPVRHYSKSVDRILSLQDRQGHFGRIPGSGGCWDFDAADILIHCGIRQNYRKADVSRALKKLFQAILSEQNEDGGFCESRLAPRSVFALFRLRNIGFVFKGFNLYCWYVKIMRMASLVMKEKFYVVSHFVSKKWRYTDSDLWNTWFRCLTLAEISKALDLNHELNKIPWNFHKTIGLGYFKDK